MAKPTGPTPDDLPAEEATELAVDEAVADKVDDIADVVVAELEPTDELGRTREDWPVGVRVVSPDDIAAGIEVPGSAWIGEHEYKVDPETGTISGKA